MWTGFKKIAWLFFILSLAVGFINESIHLQGFIYILVLGSILAVYYSQSYERLSKSILGFTIALLGFLLINHYLPGFEKLRAHSKLILSPTSKSFTIYLYFDKAAVAFLLLALGVPLIRFLADWTKTLKTVAIYSLVAIALIMPSALLSGYVNFEPKLIAITPLWLFQTLFFTCIPEECFFRGFVQKEVSVYLRHSRNGHWMGILVGTLMFSLQNLRSGSWQFVILSVISGLIYGCIYKKTDRIEAPILLHFIVNIVHFFFFTYPSLTVPQFT